MNFNQQKNRQLEKVDKSSIGNWDFKIKALCNIINKKKNYYTTSSCSGRVCLMKGLDKKGKGIFLFRNHDKLSFSNFKEEINKILNKEKNLIYFKQEPCILHVACRTLSDAFFIVRKAKEAGWKRSGVMSSGEICSRGKCPPSHPNSNKRTMVELHSTELMSFPVANNGKVLVNDGFLKLIVKLSNEKLERVWEKIERLERLV